MIAKKEIVVDGGIVAFIHVHVDIAFRSAYETVPRFSDTQLVPDCQERVEVVFLGRDVVHGDHDVDDRLGCQPGHRGGTDVFDLDVHAGEGITDSPSVIEEDTCPSIVMAVQLELEPLRTPDELDRRDVWTARLAIPLHVNILAATEPCGWKYARSMTDGPADDRERDAAMSELLGIRSSIDNIDAALIHLLAERFKFTQQVGRLKAAHGLPPADPERERRQIARLRGLAIDAHLDPAFAEKWFNFVVAEVIHHHEALAGGAPGTAGDER